MQKMGKAFLVGICFLLFTPAVQSQDYPTRSIEFTVGFPPGGVSDSTSRALCRATEKYLGKPIVVVNKPGVSQAVALTSLTGQKPDGYTLSCVAAGALIQVPFFEKVSYKIDDFCYVMGFGYQLHGLTVRAEAPWDNFKEFLQYARKNPGKVKYSSFSPVSMTSILMDLIAKKEGIDWTHIPYKGDGPAITALLGGHVDALAGASGQIPYVRSGKLKLLAIFNTYESKSFPHVPTLKSLGYNFPMLSDLVTSSGVIGPKGIKPEILKKLEEAFTKAGNDTSFVKVMESLDCPIAYKSGKELETEVFNSYQICEKILPPIAAKMEK